MKEIGSDFWHIEKKNTEYFLSGRTAEEYIIRDIIKEQGVLSALLPSLCCHTMIEPFIRHNIPVRFYDVVYDEKLRAVLPEKRDNEVLLYLDYFGYGRIEGLEHAANWDVTIEDCTHSWMGKSNSDADYSFTSFRKWTGFTAISKADKKNGSFIARCADEQNEAYEKLRRSAMQQKKRYLEKGIGYKDAYLRQFQDAEELLDADYVDFRPSYESAMKLLSLDVEMIKNCRIKNAHIIYDRLKDIKQISFLFLDIDEHNVPLNVPIMVMDGRRDELRRYLINNAVYCPVHWPLSKLHIISNRAKDIYDKELSLICDQRYDSMDMEREVELIHAFYENG